ncbi:MAG TPA: hypothetical protein VFH27_03450, partial [Longimicrobiaceae bacterium]|nr:hypothetical protein [Longimicrobiaceae bacterium]
MSTRLGQGLHPALRAFPGAVLELSPDGVVLESNGRLERGLERTLVGNRLEDVLDEPSRSKWRNLLASLPEDGGDAQLWELTLEGRDTVTPYGFYPVREVGEGGELRVWLVESPRDPRFEQLHMELMAVSSEQTTTQRQLTKEKSRLATALGEVEREFHQNEELSRALQATNEEME